MNALLALHGFTGSPRSWDFLPAELPAPRFVPALVGHSGSEAGSDVRDFEAEVDRLAQFGAHTGPLHVVGYSLGARLALGLALRHPARVSRLTLISAHPGLAAEPERAARRAADEHWCELLLREGTPAFVAAWQAQPLWATQARLDPATLARKRAERLSHDPAGLVRSLRVTGLGAMPNYRERLAELAVPLSLVAGALDAKFCALAEQMARTVAHAQLHLVAGAGHDLLLERPEFITQLLRPGHSP